MGNSLPADEITVRTENTTTSERSNVCRKVHHIEFTTSERSNVCRKVQHIEITTSERSNVCRKVQHIEITTSERSNVCLVVITLTMDAQYVSAVSVDGRLGTTDRTGNPKASKAMALWIKHHSQI
jgi:Lhr-like helicase